MEELQAVVTQNKCSKVKINRQKPQLWIFWMNLIFTLGSKKIVLQSFCLGVWFSSSETSTAEIKLVVTKKDEFDYRGELFLLALFEMSEKSRFWFK